MNKLDLRAVKQFSRSKLINVEPFDLLSSIHSSILESINFHFL